MEEVPRSDIFLGVMPREWLRRHCLRAADAGLLLPRLTLFGDGDGVCLDWQADPPDSYPRMPGEFTQSGRVWLNREDVDFAMRSLIHGVLKRTAESRDARADWLRDNWAAIAAADSNETSFCRAAGRLGLDPYRFAEWDRDLVELLETGLGEDADRPISADFLEATTKTSTMVDTWRWVCSARDAFNVEESPTSLATRLSQTLRSPASVAYRLARELRERLRIFDGPVDTVTDAAQGLGMQPLHSNPSWGFQERTGRNVEISGQGADIGRAQFAAPGPHRA
jgi:hypothetical protein